MLFITNPRYNALTVFHHYLTISYLTKQVTPDSNIHRPATLSYFK